MTSQRQKRLAVAAAVILLLATLIFIWIHSLESPADSAERSRDAVEMLEPVLELFVGRGNVTEYMVRKLAHFAEFAALGFVLALLTVLRREHGLQPYVNCLFVGLLAAVADESIQLFSQRGSQVQDVVLDFLGVTAGVLLTRLAAALIFALKKKEKAETPSGSK